MDWKEFGKKLGIWSAVCLVFAIIIGALVAMAQWKYIGVPADGPKSATEQVLPKAHAYAVDNWMRNLQLPRTRSFRLIRIL